MQIQVEFGQESLDIKLRTEIAACCCVVCASRGLTGGNLLGRVARPTKLFPVKGFHGQSGEGGNVESGEKKNLTDM